MSSPYGAPGQQGPGPYGSPGGPAPYGGPGGAGSYGGPGGAPWGPGTNVPTYGGPPSAGPQYGGPGSPGQGYGPAYGAGAQRGPQSGGQVPAGSGPGASGSGAPTSPPGAKPRTGVDFARILSLSIAALGVLAFIFGFLSAWKANQQGVDVSISVYATAAAYLPILLLLVGLLALAPLVPGGGRYTFPTALLAIVGFLGALTQLISGDGTQVISGDGSFGVSLSAGIGLILLIVVSLLQAGAAAYAWLTASGTVKPAGATPRTPRPKKPVAQAEPGQTQFGPGPASGPPSSATGFGAAYPPGADVQGGNGSAGPGSDAPPYSGYVANPYNPSTARAGDQRNPYATPTEQPSSQTPSARPDTAGNRPDDGPSPDETQQVRF